MNKLITGACAIALTAACSGTPAAQGANQLTAAPPSTAAAADGSPSRPVAEAPVSPAETQTSATPAGNPVNGVVKDSTNPIKRMFGGGPEYHEMTLPAGTLLPVDLETAVGSDTSRVEQAVSGRLRRAVMLQGIEVIPAGTPVSGNVTAVRRPGKVKGRAMIAMRFTRLDTPGTGTARMSTATIARLAPATKKKDAVKVLAPAAAGAVIGRIAGGKSGAGKGAIIGGGAGAGYVLATRGDDVRIGRGADLAVRLTAPLTLRIRTK